MSKDSSGRDPRSGRFEVRPLQEGYEKKGGINPTTSKVVARPPAPAPMRPSAHQPPKR